MPGYLRVKNFEEFQHYKDRSPQWIKLYNRILEDYEFSCLTDEQKWHLLAIWLLASRLDNKIPHDPDWIAQRIGARTGVDLAPLLSGGWLADFDTPDEIPPAVDPAGWKSRYVPSSVRAAVFEEDSRCLKCGSTERLELDHVVPVSRPDLIDDLLGGRADDPTNLQTLCVSCNRQKRSVREPEELAVWTLSSRATKLRSGLLRSAIDAVAERSSNGTESGAFARSREGEREGEGEEETEGEEKNPSCPEPAGPASGRGEEAASDPVVMEFPVIANDERPWQLRGSKMAQYADTFPALEVGPELRRARQWLIDNPAKRKTPKGMPRFLFNWLERKQNRGLGGGSSRQPAATRRPAPNHRDAELLDSLVIRSGGDRG